MKKMLLFGILVLTSFSSFSMSGFDCKTLATLSNDQLKIVENFANATTKNIETKLDNLAANVDRNDHETHFEIIKMNSDFGSELNQCLIEALKQKINDIE